MLLGSSQRLLVFLPSLAHAFPRASSSALATSTSFPSYLQAEVPECAQPCLQTILRDEYPSTCLSAGDIACYCTQYTSSGLSLGEAAYECAVASCSSSSSSSSSSEYSSTYSICDGIAAAVPATHTTLTFTAPITRTTPGTTKTGSPSTPAIAHNSTIQSTSTLAANSTAHASASTSKQTPSSTSARVSSTSVPLTTATAAGSNSTASYRKGGLSNSAVAGITVGGVAGAALLIAAVFFIAWLRKRHRQKNDDVLEKRDRDIWSVTPPADQGPDHLEPSDLAALGSLPPGPNPRPGPPADVRDPRSGGGVGISLPQATAERGWTIRLRTPTPPAEQIGLAISQDPVAVDAALVSPASTRTVSQLLPDKPEPAHLTNGTNSETGGMFQPSAAVVAVRPQLCRESSQTVFEEDSGRQLRRESDQAGAYSRNAPQIAPVRPTYQHPQFADDYVQSPEALQAPPGLPLVPPAPNYGRNTWPSPPPIPSPLRIQRPPPAMAMTTGRPVLDSSTRPYVHVTQASSSSGGTTTISSSGSISQHPTHYTTSPSSMTKTPPEHYTPHVPPQSTIRRVTQWPAGGSPPPPQAPTTGRIPTPPQFLQHSPSRYQPAVPPRKPVASHRKRASTASLTSIESASPNDPSPPDDAVSAAKQLTPPGSYPTTARTPPPAASQSPHDASPISDLRYPKVPRASNQAVPRGSSGDGHSLNASSSSSSSESTPVAVPFNRSHAPSPSPAPQTQTQMRMQTAATGPTPYAANTSKALAARRLGPGAAEHLAKGLLFNNPQPQPHYNPNPNLAPPQHAQHPPSQHYPYAFPFHYQNHNTAATTATDPYAYAPPAPPYTTVFHNGSNGMLSAGPPSSQQTGRTDRSSHASGGGDAVVPWKDPDRYSRVLPGAAARNDSSDSCGSGSGSACSGGKITLASSVVLHESQSQSQNQRGAPGREAWERYRAAPPQSQTQHAGYRYGHGYGQGYSGGGGGRRRRREGEANDDGHLWSPTGTATRLTPTREGGDSGDLVLRVGMHP